MKRSDTVYSDPRQNEEQNTNQDVSQFSLNHPKNYFGVVIAIASKQDTGFAINESLVRMGGKARAGAEALDLITRTNDLTELGETIIGMIEEETSVERELNEFSKLKGDSTRFIEAANNYWTPIVNHVLQQHQTTVDIVNVLEKTGPVTLAELAEFSVKHNLALKEILLRNPSNFDVHENSDNGSQTQEFQHPGIYRGQAIYQFKTILYHCGILTQRGADTSAVVPTQDIWELDPRILSEGGEQQ